jgi:hypothetical protein
MGTWSTAPRILNLGAWSTLAVTFAPWPHYSWCPKLKLGGPKKDSGRSRKEKTMLLWLGIFGPSTRSTVLIMTKEFVVDLGPFRWERRSPLVIRNWCIPVKNTTGWSRVAFCAYEIIHLFAVTFDVVRDGNKFHFRFVTNETPHNWRPVESHTVIRDSRFERTCMSPSSDRRRECYGLYPLCSGQLYPIEEAKVAT